MPLYEYRCLKCDRHVEKIENLRGPHLKKCPHCGGKVESVLTAPAIQFKGSGWYVTDYAKKSAGGDSGGDSSKPETAEKSEKTEKTDKAEKSESKPASSTKDQKKASGSKEK